MKWIDAIMLGMMFSFLSCLLIFDKKKDTGGSPLGRAISFWIGVIFASLLLHFLLPPNP